MQNLILSLLLAAIYISGCSAQLYADQLPTRKDGRCGPFYEETSCNDYALGRIGNCCSQFGFCGKSPSHCEWSGRYSRIPNAQGDEFISCLSSKHAGCRTEAQECCDIISGLCRFDATKSAEAGMCKGSENHNPPPVNTSITTGPSPVVWKSLPPVDDTEEIGQGISVLACNNLLVILCSVWLIMIEFKL